MNPLVLCDGTGRADDDAGTPAEDDSVRDPMRQEIAASETAVRQDLAIKVDELKRYFSLVAEQFREEFRNLFDWTAPNSISNG